MVVKKEKFLFTVKIELNEWFDNEEAFLVLRELSAKEMLSMKTKMSEGEAIVNNYFYEILPTLIVSHNFETETGKMNNNEVCEFLLSKAMLMVDLTTKFFNEAFKQPFRGK